MWKTMIYPLVYCVLTCGLGFGTCENIPDILLQLSSPVMFGFGCGNWNQTNMQAHQGRNNAWRKLTFLHEFPADCFTCCIQECFREIPSPHQAAFTKNSFFSDDGKPETCVGRSRGQLIHQLIYCIWFQKLISSKVICRRMVSSSYRSRCMCCVLGTNLMRKLAADLSLQIFLIHYISR